MTYKCSGILVHHGPFIQSMTERLLNELRRSKIRKTLPKVYFAVGCCQLCEFNPDSTKQGDIIYMVLSQWPQRTWKTGGERRKLWTGGRVQPNGFQLTLIHIHSVGLPKIID